MKHSESEYTLPNPSDALMFSVGELINNGRGPWEIVTRVDSATGKLCAKRATWWLVALYRVAQFKRMVAWRAMCAAYDLWEWVNGKLRSK